MRMFGWMLGGLVVGGAIAFAIGLLILTYANVSQAEGAAAMAVIFVFTPAGAVLGLIVGLVTGILRRKG